MEDAVASGISAAYRPCIKEFRVGVHAAFAWALVKVLQR